MSITFSRPFFLSVESCCRAQGQGLLYKHHFILRWRFFLLCLFALNKTAYFFFSVTFICLLSLLIAMLGLPCHPHNCLLDLLLSKAGDRLHCLLFTLPFWEKHFSCPWLVAGFLEEGLEAVFWLERFAKDMSGVCICRAGAVLLCSVGLCGVIQGQ